MEANTVVRFSIFLTVIAARTMQVKASDKLHYAEMSPSGISEDREDREDREVEMTKMGKDPSDKFLYYAKMIASVIRKDLKNWGEDPEPIEMTKMGAKTTKIAILIGGNLVNQKKRKQKKRVPIPLYLRQDWKKDLRDFEDLRDAEAYLRAYAEEDFAYLRAYFEEAETALAQEHRKRILLTPGFSTLLVFVIASIVLLLWTLKKQRNRGKGIVLFK